MTEATLLYLVKDDKVLLMEKQKKLGAGKLNGVGGKKEPGDKSITDTMIRESIEEMGITPTEYRKMAEIVFHNPGEDKTLADMHVHIFVSKRWSGEPTATDEMKKPQWFDIDNLPFDKTLPDDKFWLPLVLDGKKVIGEFTFNDDWTIADYVINEVENFDE